MGKQRDINSVTFREKSLEVRPSSIAGSGCFACKTFEPRHKIADYEGQAISERSARRRLQSDKHHFVCYVGAVNGKDVYVDASVGGNPTAFINHSCGPNAYFRTFRGRIGVYALKPIQPGDEITINYEFTWKEFQCDCGASSCRGCVVSE